MRSFGDVLAADFYYDDFLIWSFSRMNSHKNNTGTRTCKLKLRNSFDLNASGHAKSHWATDRIGQQYVIGLGSLQAM